MFATRQFVLFAALLFSPVTARAQEDAAKENALSFYSWYLHLNNGIADALASKEFVKFVTPDLQQKLRKNFDSNKFAEEPDYFLKVQDFDQKNWQANLSASGSVGGANEKHLVVSIGTGKEHAELCVHLKPVARTWEVSAVDPEGFAGGPPDCRTKILDGEN